MSQDSSDATSGLVSYVEAGLTTNYVICGLAALTAYEYIITIGEEISVVWKRKCTSGTILFIINRYILVVYTILVFIPATAQNCEGVTRSGQVLALAQYVVFGLFSALRVYALWDRNVLLFLLILGLNMVPVATNIYNFKTITVTLYTIFPALGAACIEISSMSDTAYFRFSLATRLAVVLADILVLVLTWMKTFGTRREASRIHIEVPMITLLIRDGTIYFIALLAMNVAQILIQNISIFQLFSPVSQFITVLTPILISRFFLNLRQVDRSHGSSEMERISRFTVPLGFEVHSDLDLISDIGRHDPDHDGAREATSNPISDLERPEELQRR